MVVVGVASFGGCIFVGVEMSFLWYPGGISLLFGIEIFLLASRFAVCCSALRSSSSWNQPVRVIHPVIWRSKKISMPKRRSKNLDTKKETSRCQLKRVSPLKILGSPGKQNKDPHQQCRIGAPELRLRHGKFYHRRSHPSFGIPASPNPHFLEKRVSGPKNPHFPSSWRRGGFCQKYLFLQSATGKMGFFDRKLPFLAKSVRTKGNGGF